MNVQDRERSTYIFEERKKGRTFADIASELGISRERVRQIFRVEDWERNGVNSDAWRRLVEKHPEDGARLIAIMNNRE